MNEPCQSCRFVDVCCDPDHPEYARNEGDWAGDALTKRKITQVHTCGTCGLRKFSTHDAGDDANGEVPEDCPRWDPRFGSALDCVACFQLRDEIRAAHPLNAQRHEALKGAILGAVGKKESEQDKAAIEKFVTLMMPGGAIQDGDNYEPALELMAYFWAEALDKLNLGGLPEEMVKGLQIEWMEYIFLSLQRNPDDPAQVTLEIVLMLTDRSPTRRAWYPLTPEERSNLRATWKARVRRVMGIREEARC